MKRVRNGRNTGRSFARAFSIVTLAVALVSAQIAGIAHRVKHAPGLGGQPAQWQALLAQDHDGNRSHPHDCAAYDAATLGAGPPAATAAQFFAPPAAQSLIAAVVSLVADNSPHLPFHSRAPPRT